MYKNNIYITEGERRRKNVKNIMLKLFALFLFICFGTLVSGAQLLLDQPIVEGGRLRPGEVLEYSVKVKGIPAGTQTMQINGKELLRGREVYHVESTSTVNRFFYLLYPFSDRSESFILSKELCPLSYKRDIRDGGYRGSITVDFDDAKQVARVVKDQKRMELRVPDGIQDELSMIYLVRTKKIDVGKEYEFPALIGGTRALRVGIAVLRVENIKTIFGTIKTIVVKSIPRDVTMWMTQDSARIPVRMEVSTKIGKLVADLKSVR